jgi:MerR family transcriptional regulator, light-induced transcriptional regulator
LYSQGDLRRVQEVLKLRDQGVAVSSACRAVLATERSALALSTPELAFSSSVSDLLSATKDFDETKLQAILDRQLRGALFETVLADDLIPFLTEVGRRWQTGGFTIAHEHFASSVIRHRLAALAHTWSLGSGPLAVLACPSGEQHDVMLLAFGVLLARRGWRVRYLGANIPITSLETSISDDVAIIVLGATRSEVFEAVAEEVGALAQRHLVVIGGAGAQQQIATRLGVAVLPQNPATAADDLTRQLCNQ